MWNWTTRRFRHASKIFCTASLFQAALDTRKKASLAGAHLGDRITARMVGEQHTIFTRMYREAGRPPLPLTQENFRAASRFAERLERVRQEHIVNSIKDLAYWRFISGLSAFLDGCRTVVERYDVRLHQFARAIESFLPSDACGADRFAQYVKRLVTDSQGADTVTTLKEIYRLRSKFEHHEHWKEAKISGAVPETTVIARLHQAEALCREIYRRMLANTSDNSGFWRSASDIKDLWSKAGGLDAIWGYTVRSRPDFIKLSSTVSPPRQGRSGFARIRRQ
jgi:hypothetical protein